METKGIITVAVTVTVAVIVLAGIMIPVLDDATTVNEKFTNEGLYYMTNPTESTTVKYLGNSEWEVNGEPLVYTNVGATNILIFDGTFVRNNGQVRGAVYQTWSAAELTIANGTVTGTATASGTPTSINWTYTDSYVATNDSSAAYIMKSNTSQSYINEDSPVIGMGLTSVKDADGVNQSVPFYVTVEGLQATVSTVAAYESQVSISEVKVNYTDVDGFEDLYLFSSVTFKATWGTNTTNVTYNTVIVPHEVTAEKSVHLTDSMNGLLAVIPILILVAILIGVAAVVLRNRM